MDRCAGFENEGARATRNSTLPCHPMTVIYGHAATRGLSIERWTKGLDSGCVSPAPSLFNTLSITPDYSDFAITSLRRLTAADSPR